MVQPTNILFVSRISNNTFCTFLNSKEILESLLAKTQVVNINGHKILVRRLLNPAKRIVISNIIPVYSQPRNIPIPQKFRYFTHVSNKLP